LKVFLQFFLVVLAGCSNADFNSDDYVWLDPGVRAKVQNSFEELRISRPQIEFPTEISQVTAKSILGKKVMRPRQLQTTLHVPII